MREKGQKEGDGGEGNSLIDYCFLPGQAQL